MSLTDHLRALRGSTAVARVVGADHDPETTASAEAASVGNQEAEAVKTGEQPAASTETTTDAASNEVPAVDQPAAAADPAEVAAYCHANGAGALTAGLIKDKATMPQVKERVDAVGTIRAMVADAGKVTASITAKMADDFINAGMTVEQVRTQLFETLVKTQSPEIRGAIAADTAVPTASHGWDSAVDRVNARIPG